MSASEFRAPVLTEAQWQQVKALATSLDPKQLLWLSGFFAGIEHGVAPPAPSLGPTGPSAPLADRSAAGRTLTVLYGSETGNSTGLATTLAEQAAARGLMVSLRDMATYKIRQFKDEQDLLIITSTYGEGDPPQPAAGFFEFVEGRKAPKLPNLRFAVLGLGDSTYEHFCEAGKRLDRRLQELGGRRLLPRVDCDVDYDEPAAVWIGKALEAFGDAQRPHEGSSIGVTQPESKGPARDAIFDKRNPFPARTIDNIVLTGRGSSKETRHVELSLEGSGLTFEPGDALGITASNDPALVGAILSELDLVPSSLVKTKDGSHAIGDALINTFEITALTPRFLEHWAGISDAPALKRLTQSDYAHERVAFSRGHHLIDVIRQFPVKGIDAETLVAGLRPLQPRLYSIASSAAAIPDEVHLTIATVRYDLHGEQRSGVASGHLARHVAPDDVLPVYVQPNPHFRLPADDVPIIMIGAGTGIAPYRAFMQEREARGAAGRSWLFFGERNFRTDFLYQTEWQALLKDRVLTRMNVAFSRDRRTEEDTATYVQHRLTEQARDIFAWLDEGAHLYVCGDASRLAPDVHKALAAIVASVGGLGSAATEDYLQRLQRDRRYLLDVY